MYYNIKSPLDKEYMGEIPLGGGVMIKEKYDCLALHNLSYTHNQHCKEVLNKEDQEISQVKSEGLTIEHTSRKRKNRAWVFLLCFLF